jgi:hypothetical protein
MTKRIPVSRAERIDEDQLRQIVEELGWDKQLTFDYQQRRALLNGEDTDFIALAEHIKSEYRAMFPNQMLYTLLNGIARVNSPKVNEEEVLLELVAEYVSDKAEVSVREIIEAHDGKRGFDIINKSLEMRISKCLKQLGYCKYRRKIDKVIYRVWIKPSEPENNRTYKGGSLANPYSTSSTDESEPVNHNVYNLGKNSADELLDLVNAALQ